MTDHNARGYGKIPPSSNMAIYSKILNFMILLFPALYACFHFSGVIVTVVFCVVGVLCGSALALFAGGPRVTRRRVTYPTTTDHQLATRRMLSVKQYPSSPSVPFMFSPALDSRIQEVLDLVNRHHIAPFYQRYGRDAEEVYRSLQPELWSVLSSLKDRLYKVDMLQLMSQDTITVFINHLQWLKKFGGGNDDNVEPSIPFYPNLDNFPYLSSPEAELNFLRQICDVFFCATLPTNMLKCSAVRTLYREFLLTYIILPSIERLCDPDFLNQHLLHYLEQREKGVKKAKTKYSKAETYELFVKYLEKCNSIDELQHTRELILVDMIQAKAVLKMKSEKVHTGGLGVPDIPMPAEKVEQLRSRKNLPAYIKQLGTCMQVCDKRIKKLGGADMSSGLGASANQLHSSASASIRLPFDQLLASPKYREAFCAFLSSLNMSHLLNCWEELEKMQDLKEGSHLEELKRIHDSYLAFNATRFVDMDPQLVQRMDKVLSGDTQETGVISEVKKRLFAQLQAQFYHSFLTSRQYLEMRKTTAGSVLPDDPVKDIVPGMDTVINTSFSEEVEEGRHERRLRELKAKLKDVNHSLEELPSRAAKHEAASQRKRALEKQRRTIIEEIHQLDNYIQRMSDWYGSIGEWTVTVTPCELDDATDPTFMLVIGHSSTTGEMIDDQENTFEELSVMSTSPFLNVSSEPTRKVSTVSRVSDASERTSISSEVSDGSVGGRYRDGWVVNRKLSEFKALHTKLSQMNQSLRFPNPPRRKSLIGNLSMLQTSSSVSPDTDLHRYGTLLTEYLGRIVMDEILQSCELVFLFLSPPYQLILGQVPEEEKKSSIPSALKEILPSLKFESLVDPLFSLLVEIFELGDWKMAFRKRLMDFIQFAFGSDLDRQVQEAVAWYISEPMMVHYLEVFRDSWWPEGTPRPRPPVRTDKEKEQTREEVRQKLLKNPPFFIQSIVGNQNCQVGLEKLFRSFQNPQANRQLFFAFLEILIRAVVPELLEVEKDLAQPMTPT